ncbi:MAG: hypothetical protein J6Q13_02945 [Clostridia bacterium]|nr:hypothetical protein [Clostridia bacterium]
MEAIKAIKTCIKGVTTKEVVTEYAIDEETGKLKIVKQKVSEKYVPPSVDLLKLIYPHMAEEKLDYASLTEEELEREKLRLLKELKESEDVGGKNKHKD